MIKRNGSISAEHGIGQQKIALMNKAHRESELRLMASIKNVLDPQNILNPGIFVTIIKLYIFLSFLTIMSC